MQYLQSVIDWKKITPLDQVTQLSKHPSMKHYYSVKRYIAEVTYSYYILKKKKKKKTRDNFHTITLRKFWFAHIFITIVTKLMRKSQIFLFIIQTIFIHCTRQNKYISMKPLNLLNIFCVCKFYTRAHQIEIIFLLPPTYRAKRILFVTGSSNFVGLKIVRKRFSNFPPTYNAAFYKSCNVHVHAYTEISESPNGFPLMLYALYNRKVRTCDEGNVCSVYEWIWEVFYVWEEKKKQQNYMMPYV